MIMTLKKWPEETEEEKKQAECLAGELECCRKEHMEQYSRSETNRKAIAGFLKNRQELCGLICRYEWVNDLNRTANGTLPGNVKLDFETYVQRQYFRQIIHSANLPVAAQVRAMLPVFCGISGS